MILHSPVKRQYLKQCIFTVGKINLIENDEIVVNDQVYGIAYSVVETGGKRTV